MNYDLNSIFSELLLAIREARRERLLVNHRGVHTWRLKGAHAVEVSIVRGPAGQFYLQVESPTFVRNFVVASPERQQELLAALAPRHGEAGPTIESAEARPWGEPDGLVL